MTLTQDVSRPRRQGFKKGLCDLYVKEGEMTCPPDPRTSPGMLTFHSLKLKTEKKESQQNYRTEVASRTLGRATLPHTQEPGTPSQRFPERT